MLARLLTLAILFQAQAPAPSFSETVLRNFDVWDANHDGKLAQSEIDSAALKPDFHGADAAALAALHRWMDAADGQTPSLTKDWFNSYKPSRLRIARGTSPEDAKKARKAYTAESGSLQGSFTASFRRLSRKGDPDLFGEEGPQLSDIRQGALGDCYMLAPLGALVHRSNSDIKKMIVRDGDGYRVRFADGKEVHVGALTDSELAMGGSSTKNGLWIRIVEKAYGSRKLSEGEAKIATDSMHGGSSGTAGKAFTGHKFTSIALVGDFQKDVPKEKIEAKMAELRIAIPRAASQHLLMTAGTPKRTMPKSISPNHAYAVFAYDAASDRITLWNPHGNDFTPKGEEGPKFGYKIEDGVFSMPLEMFVRTFGRILFEQKESH